MSERRKVTKVERVEKPRESKKARELEKLIQRRVKPIWCERCRREFRSERDYSLHVRILHPDLFFKQAMKVGVLSDVEVTCRCRVCGRRFATVEEYVKHLNERHPEAFSNRGVLHEV
mgnify:CR=1 FL=1